MVEWKGQIFDIQTHGKRERLNNASEDNKSSKVNEQCTLVWEVGECRVARKKRGEREGKLMERRN